VQSIDICLFGKRNLLLEFLGEILNGFSDRQLANSCQRVQAFLSRDCVTGAALVDDELGDVEFVFFAMLVSPIVRELLICGR